MQPSPLAQIANTLGEGIDKEIPITSGYNRVKYRSYGDLQDHSPSPGKSEKTSW